MFWDRTLLRQSCDKQIMRSYKCSVIFGLVVLSSSQITPRKIILFLSTDYRTKEMPSSWEPLQTDSSHSGSVTAASSL
jgi:hypothetical protein